MKEISISDKISTLTREYDSVEAFLEKVSDLLRESEGIKIIFCKIIHKRWSHIAGRHVILSSGIRGMLNTEYGYIIEELPEDFSESEEIFTVLKESLKRI